MSDHPRLDSKKPLLGTQWLESQLELYSRDYGPAKDTNLGKASPSAQSICLHLSDFKKHLQRYRKLDDSISLALNRSFVIFRSSNPESKNGNSFQTHSEGECARFWKLLTESWVNREHLIKSCINSVDQSVQTKIQHLQSNQSSHPPSSSLEILQQRRALESEVHNETLKRRMIHNELTVESAIRKQSLHKFRSQCPHSLFAIPPDSPKVEIDPYPSP
ncbi:hypothetical protein O181_044026 [Austropuccinia psidii MF-1]|uniref:Uncharacterized protein n=1 Tax=Austropuccinia psidii MF-1 TaxID=1389203 RepID=A0A9Q3HGI5_9BASI|nr:hypothetical protein [Austropuccinia psidii MF-1]